MFLRKGNVRLQARSIGRTGGGGGADHNLTVDFANFLKMGNEIDHVNNDIHTLYTVTCLS